MTNWTPDARQVALMDTTYEALEGHVTDGVLRVDLAAAYTGGMERLSIHRVEALRRAWLADDRHTRARAIEERVKRTETP
jgi:hypothetical protein